MRKLMFAIVFILAMPFVNAQKWEFVGMHCKDRPGSEYLPLESRAIVDLDNRVFSFKTDEGLSIKFNIKKVETSYEDGYSSLIMTSLVWEASMYGSDDEKIILLFLDGRVYSGVLVAIKE